MNVLITGVDLAEVLGRRRRAGRARPAHHRPAALHARRLPALRRRRPGPNCGAAGPNSRHERLLTTTGTNWGGDSASVGSRTEQRVVRSAASTITHLPAARIDPVLADLLLGPILRGTPTFVSPGVTK